MNAKRSTPSARRRALRRAAAREQARYDSTPVSKRSAKRRKGRGLRDQARDSQGQRSDWTRSPYYKTATTIDARWSK